MSSDTASVAEITTAAITLLCREIGPVNTARFLGQFTAGLGNYTEERDAILGHTTVDELVAEIKQRRDSGLSGTKPPDIPNHVEKPST